MYNKLLSVQLVWGRTTYLFKFGIVGILTSLTTPQSDHLLKITIIIYTKDLYIRPTNFVTQTF